MVQQLYQNLQRYGMLRIFRPRYTLHEPTRSGVAHQFDIVIRAENEKLIGIECKFRGKTGIADLFAFVGKLIDYRERPYGVFVTTASHVNDEVFYYAIAHRISIICKMLLPVEYMKQKVKKGTDLAQRIERLQVRLRDDNQPQYLLIEWRNACNRFTAEGYQ